MLDKAFAQFDETNLASNMDTLALTLLGRKLTSSEYEELKSTIELFAKPREELLQGGNPIGDLQIWNLHNLMRLLKPNLPMRLIHALVQRHNVAVAV